MDIIVITCIFWNLKRSNTAVNRYTRIACRKLFISTLAHTQEYVKHKFHGNNLQVRQIDYQTMSEIPVWRWLFCYWQIAKNTIYYDHRYSLNAMNKFNQLPELMPIRSCMWRLPNSRKVLVFIRCSKASAKFAISDAWWSLFLFGKPEKLEKH